MQIHVLLLSAFFGRSQNIKLFISNYDVGVACRQAGGRGI